MATASATAESAAEPSIQFDPELMQMNLAVMAERWPDLLQQLPEPASIKDLEFELVTDVPSPVLRVNGIQLASGYDRHAEAATVCAQIKEATDEAWIYGLTYPELALGMLARDGIRRVEAVVMNRGVLVMLMALIDFQELFSHQGFELTLATDDTQIMAPGVVSPPGLRLADGPSMRLRDALEISLASEFQRQYWTNQDDFINERLKANEKYTYHDPGIDDLFDTDVGGEAVVALPGPSINSNYERIRELQQQGHKIYAVDGTVRPLLANGIIPDIVATIDPDEKLALEHFGDDLSLMKDSTLVYFPCTGTKVIEFWPGNRKLAFHSSSKYGDLLKLRPDCTLYCAGTVAHVAIDVAVRTGAKTIRLFGGDFGFPGGQVYAKEITSSALHDQIYRSLVVQTWVENGHGERIRSMPNFVMYLRQLEKYVASYPNVDFINMSRDGACIKGTRYEDEEEAHV